MLPILSRLLLCLCLLVDTVGPAMAATHLARSAGPSEPAPSAAAATAAVDCHGIEAAPDSSRPPAPAPVPEDGNCLERCLELCLQHGVATLPASVPLPPLPAAMPAASGIGTQMPRAHAFPPLRPPIG